MSALDYELPPAELPLEDGGRYDGFADPFAGGSFTYLGKMPYKRSLDIVDSPIGVGYETLDRDTFDPVPTYKFMANSGAKWARIQSGWNRSERENGVYDFDWLDKIVDGLLGIGMKPWISLSFGNSLHTPVPAYEDYKRNHPPEKWPQHIRGYVGEVPLYHGPAAIAAWERYVRALAHHFKGRISHWEIWNEPNVAKGNTASFWGYLGRAVYPDLDFVERLMKMAADYVELLRISRAQVLAEIPDAQIIAGSITNGCNAPAYIDGLGRASVGKYADIISFHPYGFVPEFNLAARFNFIKENTRINGKALRIWQGECGRTAGAPMGDCSLIPSEYNQAKFLTRRFVSDIALGAEVSSFFNVSDFTAYQSGEGDFMFGLIHRKEKRPKLAYEALRSIAYLFEGIESAPDLYVHLRTMSFASMMRYQLSVSQFRRKGVPLFAFYFPEHPDVPFEAGSIDLQFYVKETDTFTQPVVIDPIRRNIYRPDAFDKPEGGHGALRIKPFPFTDYPLFLTDLSALQDTNALFDENALPR